MNDKSQAVVRSEADGDARPASKADESPGHSSTQEAQADRPSLFDWLAGYFKQRNGTLREEIADALAEGQPDEMSFAPAERAMLENILQLREVRVEDVMIPRADMQAVELSTTLGELLVRFEDSGHSRLPVYAESLDDPRGMIHIRDVVTSITRRARQRRPKGKTKAPVELNLGEVDLTKTIAELKLIRPVLFVPASMQATELMQRMRTSRTQLALVIDEYGGTDGLVSLEDLVEMVVGDISDEHDEDVPLITRADDGAFIIDGKAEIEDAASAIGERFRPGEFGDNVDTIGGLVVNAAGRVPRRGTTVDAVPGFTIQVLDADPRRVKRVRIAPVAEIATPGA